MTRTVVITGSTRGIGFGLAEAFLARGCHVTITGRGQAAVEEAVNRLAARHPRERISGTACDVTDLAQVRALFDFAARATGKVDVWINNAGAGSTQVPFVKQPPEQLDAIVRTNLLGTVLATRVALERMTAQGSGQIFNFEGFGADGRMKRLGMAVYGATKSATRYFTASVAKECEGGPVSVGTLSPGVVVTDMLKAQFDGVPKEQWEDAKRLYNTIGDEVGTVAPWLADRVLANEKNGAAIAWLTLPKVIGRFVIPKYRRRELFG